MWGLAAITLGVLVAGWIIVYQGSRKTFPNSPGQGGWPLFLWTAVGVLAAFYILAVYVIGDPHPVRSIETIYRYGLNSDGTTLKLASGGDLFAKLGMLAVGGYNLYVFGRVEM